MITPSLSGCAGQATKTKSQGVSAESTVCPELYSEPRQTSKMDHFAKILSSWNPLTTFSKTLHSRCLAGL